MSVGRDRPAEGGESADELEGEDFLAAEDRERWERREALLANLYRDFGGIGCGKSIDDVARQFQELVQHYGHVTPRHDSGVFIKVHDELTLYLSPNGELSYGRHAHQRMPSLGGSGIVDDLEHDRFGKQNGTGRRPN